LGSSTHTTSPDKAYKKHDTRETLISLRHMVLSVIQHCAHYAPQQRIDILWHPYSMSLQMQRHVPPPKRRDTHREPLKVPLNLPKAHHRDYWVCYNWNSTATSWRWYVHRAHCSLVCTSEVKTSVRRSLTYPKKKKKYIKNIKKKLATRYDLVSYPTHPNPLLQAGSNPCSCGSPHPHMGSPQSKGPAASTRQRNHR
jgi:hypothetical protein